MENIRIGSFIRERRKNLGLTQEQVCDGICDPVSLSRIENNKQTPGRAILDALMQRLGMPDSRYYILSSPEELAIDGLKRKIIACNVTRNAALGFAKVAELQKLTSPGDHLTRQFILRAKAVLEDIDGSYSLEEQMALLEEAIRITCPRFDLDHLQKCLYTVDEIKIIAQIANLYSDSGEHEKATGIFSQLLEYIEKHLDEAVTSGGGLVPMIYFDYARALDLAGHYREGAHLALEGKQACTRWGSYDVLGGCLEIYAECCYFLGEEAESAEAYTQAYYISKAIGRQDDTEIIRREAEEYLGLSLR